MILELRFDQLRPGAAPQFATRFLQALPERDAVSPLAGAWSTEVGGLDQVVQLWAYRDLAHRDEAVRQAAQLPAWSTFESSDLFRRQDSQLLQAAAFSPAIEARALGAVYELRIYEYEAGAIPRVLERWEEKLLARTGLSPLVLCGWSVSGRLNQWFHMWAYTDLAERRQIREEAVRTKVWPPESAGGLLRQRNMLLTPTDFSPLR